MGSWCIEEVTPVNAIYLITKTVVLQYNTACSHLALSCLLLVDDNLLSISPFGRQARIDPPTPNTYKVEHQGAAASSSSSSSILTGTGIVTGDCFGHIADALLMLLCMLIVFCYNAARHL